MNKIPETANDKLIHILKNVGNMTKSRLAKELETTYLNIHRWVENPDKLVRNVQMRRDIDSLFKKYIDIRPMVLGIVKAGKDPLEILKNDAKVRDRFFISMTYNSNAIEGNRMTERETELIFQDQTIKGKVSDIMEVVNHRDAMIYLLNSVHQGFRVTEEYILCLHDKVMRGFDSKLPGRYRTGYVNITNTEVVVPNAQQVPVQMTKLLKTMNDYEMDVIGRVALTHHAFEVIHPFFDGNGRVGRLLMISQLLANGLPPAIVRYDDRYNYYWALDKANIKETEHIIQFVCDCILIGFTLINQNPFQK
jgi:Fic family protein